MTLALVHGWVALNQQLGVSPWDAAGWTLDEALTTEIFLEDWEQVQRRAAAEARRKTRR